MKICPTCQRSYSSSFANCPADGTPLAQSGQWSDGTVIRGKYRILQKLGQGAMGSVYKALHTDFNEIHALKLMAAELANDKLFVKRFKLEAVFARKLQHPNVVRVEDVDETEEGQPFIVMEYIEGRNLWDLMKSGGPLAVERVCSIVKQLASALDAAHRLDIVHRDIKPQNIMIFESSGGEVPKVLDFGIARIKEAIAGASTAMSLSHTGMVVGTPPYMSPEQAKGVTGDKLDGRSDIYSLGVVMYQMLTEELPIKADTPIQFFFAHIQTPPIPISNARPDVKIPPPIAEVVMKCLEKEPDQRFQTGQALIDKIEAWESDRVPQKLSTEERSVHLEKGGKPEQLEQRHERNERQATFRDAEIAKDLGPKPEKRQQNETFGKSQEVVPSEALEPRSPVAPLQKSRGAIFAFVLSAVAAVTVIAYMSRTTQITVPDLTGITLFDATTKLEAAHLAIGSKTYQQVAEKLPETVLSQSPPPNARVKSGTVVDVLLAQQPAMVKTPPAVGNSIDAAEPARQQQRLATGNISQQQQPGVAPRNTAPDESPKPGEKAGPGSALDTTAPELSKQLPTEPSVPNFSGIWVQTDPMNPNSPPMRTKISQTASQFTIWLSYTGTFAQSFDQGTIQGGKGAWMREQGCAPRFQKPGYDYTQPGMNIYTLELNGSALIYTQETDWFSPCDGHPVGTERTVKHLQRSE